jgi:hypothetical protein
MTTISVARHTPRWWLARRDIAETHPGWWLYAAAGTAWVVLVVWAVVDVAPAHDTSAMPAMANMPAMPTVPPPVHHHAHGWWAWGAHWVLMVVAMMWPLYAASAAALRRTVFRRWQAATIAMYLATLTALWLAVGYSARGVYLLAAPVIPAWAWSAGWLVVAIAALRSLWRARLLWTCQQVKTLAPSGRRALTGAAVLAARAWPRCAALCGPVMIAMAAAHPLPLMVGASAAVWWEQRHPRAWRDPMPVALLGGTLIATVSLSLITEGPSWLM